MIKQLASDNYSGICPEALEYMLKANAEDDLAYGDDHWTLSAADRFRELFETDCEVYFVFNGTAANALSLATLCQSYHSVICHELAHVETDECGAPEFASNGAKLLLGEGPNGKLTPDSLNALITKRQDIHYPKPKVVSVTQPTEVGTLYSLEELQAINEVSQQHNLKIHMDGARFANAVASLGVSPADLTWRQGVDVLCFSGTKNGLAVGEAIVFFDKALAEDFGYRCKQAGHLASKMRFISAPWLGLLKSGAWLANAQHANRCAAYLSEKLQAMDSLQLMFPTQANAVFIEMPQPMIAGLKQRGWRFYTFIGAGGVRLVTSWNTTYQQLDAFIEDVQQLVSGTDRKAAS